MLRLLIFATLLQLMPAQIFAEESPPVQSTDQHEPDTDEANHDQAEELSSYVLVEIEAERHIPSQSASVTKTSTPLHETPMSVSVVTSGLLESQGAEVLGDALNNISGAAAHTGFGVFDFFTIRGFDSLSAGLVLTDGTPEPESTFYHLYNIERVEVLKGPSASLYGGNPLAASVNLVRKSPVFENLLKAGGSVGSFGTVRGTLDVNRVSANEQVAFRLNAFGRTSNGYRDDKENWQAGINPAVSLRFGSTSLLNLNFEYARNEYEPDSGIPLFMNEIANVPRTRSYQSPFDSSVQDVYRFKAEFSKTLSSTTLLRNKFYFSGLDWISKGTLFPAVFPTMSGGVNVYRTLMQLDDSQKLLGNQTELSFTFRTGELRHELLTGFEISRLADVFTLDLAALPPIDLYSPVETAELPLFNIPGLDQAADTRNWVLAPYILDNISISERLRLLIGARFDALDFEDSRSGLKRDSQNFSPIVGVSYLVIPELSLYAHYGQAFAPPSSQAVGDLKPEESNQFEIGAKVKMADGKVVAGMAIYNLERENIAIPDETGFQRQLGDQRSRGLELDLRTELSSDLYLFGSYAYTSAELTHFTELYDPSLGQYPPVLVDRSGNTPAFAPSHIANLSFLKLFRCGVTLGMGGRYLSSQFIAPDNQFAIDGSFVLDASAAYRFDSWQLRLNLKNLTGEEYETRGFGSTSVLPADRFSFSAGVDFIK